MFCLVGICAYLAWSLLAPVDAPLLLALAGLGWVLDLRLRRLRPEGTPQLPWIALFTGWAMVTLAVNAPGQIPRQAGHLAAPLAIYFLIAHGVQSFRALRTVSATLVLAALVLAFVGAEQGTAPRGCFRQEESKLAWDGRRCDSPLDCEREEGAEPGVDYHCEHVGLFHTESLGGRARYLGAFADPDALALVVVMALPLAFALLERRRALVRAIGSVAILALVSACVIFTRSHSGELALLVAIALMLLLRLGARGLVGIAIAAGIVWAVWDPTPHHSMEAWYEGVRLFRGAPFFGVGLGQYAEHRIVMARSAFVVLAAELGFVGLFAWAMVLYTTLKVPFAALRRHPDVPEVRAFGRALAASSCALVVGLLFLPLQLQVLPWIFVGLSGALASSVRSHDSGFEVGLRWYEPIGVAIASAVLMVTIAAWTA